VLITINKELLSLPAEATSSVRRHSDIEDVSTKKHLGKSRHGKPRNYSMAEITYPMSSLDIFGGNRLSGDKVFNPKDSTLLKVNDDSFSNVRAQLLLGQQSSSLSSSLAEMEIETPVSSQFSSIFPQNLTTANNDVFESLQGLRFPDSSDSGNSSSCSSAIEPHPPSSEIDFDMGLTSLAFEVKTPTHPQFLDVQATSSLRHFSSMPTLQNWYHQMNDPQDLDHRQQILFLSHEI
jgi:hypothetical protein